MTAARLAEMRQIAKARGGKCLSTTYVNNHSKLEWQCAKGHTWMAAPSSVKNHGKWCAICAGVAKKTIEQMKAIAKERGGECLSKRYVNGSTKLQWRCAEGHVWKARPNYIWNAGTWCPLCAGRGDTIKHMRELARERGGQCLSTRFVAQHTKLQWRCAQGHVWWTTPSIVRRGHWCPSCAPRGRRPMADIRALAVNRGGKCLSRSCNGVADELRWRCADGHEWSAPYGRIERGSWCPECAGVARRTIEDMRRVARERGGKCLSKRYVNGRTKLRWQCRKKHEWRATPDAVLQRTWCPECNEARSRAGLRPLTMEDMQAAAQAHGGRCLSSIYINIHQRLLWECAEGHQWRTSGNSVRQGSWCPMCAGVAKDTIEHMRELAAEHGGRCLSRTYVNGRTKLAWRCRQGHRFEATATSVKQGRWCLACARLDNGRLERCQEIARRNGGECLSRVYQNSYTNLRWRCAKGHVWKATPASITRGTWCRRCAHEWRRRTFPAPASARAQERAR